MPAQVCAKRIKKIRKNSTARSIKTFKIIPKTLMNLPLPATLAFDTPTIQSTSEITAVIAANIISVTALPVIISAVLTTIFKSVKRKPIVALVLDLFTLLRVILELFTVPFSIFTVFGKTEFLCKKIKAFKGTPFIF